MFRERLHKIIISAGHRRFILSFFVCFLFPFFFSCRNPIMVDLLSPFNKTNARIPVINTQPMSNSYDFGESASSLTVSATVSDGGTLSYQWFKNGAEIPGETSDTYVPVTSVLGDCSYHVVVTNTIADNGDRGNKSAAAVSSTANINVSLISLDGISRYLSSVSHGSVPSDPVSVPAKISLGDTTGSVSVWNDLLGIIDVAGVYVDLDLSACSIIGSGFGSSYAGPGGKDRIVSIVLPSGISSISESAFSNCTSLVDIKPLNGITSIGQAAFSGCEGLKQFKLPDGVTSIEVDTFSGCSGLTTVNLSSVSSVGNNAFAACENLASITIGGGCVITLTIVGDPTRFDLFFIYYYGSSSQAAGTYTWNAGAWSGPH